GPMIETNPPFSISRLTLSSAVVSTRSVRYSLLTCCKWIMVAPRFLWLLAVGSWGPCLLEMDLLQMPVIPHVRDDDFVAWGETVEAVQVLPPGQPEADGAALGALAAHHEDLLAPLPLRERAALHAQRAGPHGGDDVDVDPQVVAQLAVPGLRQVDGELDR